MRTILVTVFACGLLWTALMSQCSAQGRVETAAPRIAGPESKHEDSSNPRPHLSIFDGHSEAELTESDKKHSDSIKQLAEDVKKNSLDGNQGGILLNRVLGDARHSEPVLEAYQKWLVQYYGRQAEALEDQKNAIRTTNVISYFVCIVVHIAFFICLWIAINECRHAEKLRTQEKADTEMKIALNAISVTTSRQGIVLLIVSLVLYFLYLSIVYPIVTVG